MALTLVVMLSGLAWLALAVHYYFADGDALNKLAILALMAFLILFPLTRASP